jgi:hypothetical protein
MTEITLTKAPRLLAAAAAQATNTGIPSTVPVMDARTASAAVAAAKI